MLVAADRRHGLGLGSKTKVIDDRRRPLPDQSADARMERCIRDDAVGIILHGVSGGCLLGADRHEANAGMPRQVRPSAGRADDHVIPPIRQIAGVQHHDVGDLRPFGADGTEQHHFRPPGKAVVIAPRRSTARREGRLIEALQHYAQVRVVEGVGCEQTRMLAASIICLADEDVDLAGAIIHAAALGFKMPQPDIMHVDVAISSLQRAEAKIYIIECDRQILVEAANFLKNRSPHNEAGACYRRHLSRILREAVIPRRTLVDTDMRMRGGDTDAQHDSSMLDRSVVVEQFRSDCANIRENGIAHQPAQPRRIQDLRIVV